MPCQTTRVDSVKERRGALTAAAWITKGDPVLLKTHTLSAGELKNSPHQGLSLFYSFTVLIDFSICMSWLVSLPIYLFVFCSFSYGRKAKSGGKEISHHPLLKLKAKRKSGAARRVKKLVAQSVWPLDLSSVSAAVQSSRAFFSLKQNNSLILFKYNKNQI